MDWMKQSWENSDNKKSSEMTVWKVLKLSTELRGLEEVSVAQFYFDTEN